MSEQEYQDDRRRELLKKKEQLLQMGLSSGTKPCSLLKKLHQALRVERLLSKKSHKP